MNRFALKLNSVVDLFQEIINMKNKFGRLYKMYLGTELWLVLSDPKDLEVRGNNYLNTICTHIWHFFIYRPCYRIKSCS